MADTDPRVMAVAAALAKAATEEFVRISGGEGRRWDDLLPDRQQRAIQSQIRYARIAVATVTVALRDEVERLQADQYAILTTPGESSEVCQCAAAKAFALQDVIDLIDRRVAA